MPIVAMPNPNNNSPLNGFTPPLRSCLEDTGEEWAAAAADPPCPAPPARRFLRASSSDPSRAAGSFNRPPPCASLTTAAAALTSPLVSSSTSSRPSPNSCFCHRSPHGGCSASPLATSATDRRTDSRACRRRAFRHTFTCRCSLKLDRRFSGGCHAGSGGASSALLTRRVG